MCVDPVTGITIATTLANTYASAQATEAKNKALDYNAGIQRHNAELADIQATEAERLGRTQEAAHRREVGQFRGSQRAGFGASGVLVDSGSTADAVARTTELGEMDAMTIRHNAALEAWGLREQGKQYRQSAKMAEAQKQSSLLSGGGTLLTGLSPLLKNLGGGK